MKVKFLPQNIELEIRPNQSVMHLAHENGIYVKSVCKGLPSCAECRVRVVDNEHNVLPPLSPELALIGSGHFVDGRRLSCQLKCFGDVTVDLSEQVEKEKNIHAGKKLKGGRPSDAMESMAVRGNILQQEVGEAGESEDSYENVSTNLSKDSTGEQGVPADRRPQNDTQSGQRHTQQGRGGRDGGGQQQGRGGRDGGGQQQGRGGRDGGGQQQGRGGRDGGGQQRGSQGQPSGGGQQQKNNNRSSSRGDKK